MSIAPDGRKPLSASTSHSYPRLPWKKVAVWPARRDATDVLRQKRRAEYSEPTVSASFAYPLTLYRVPVSAFCGRPPSAGGEYVGSAHEPVQSLVFGSTRVASWVSL